MLRAVFFDLDGTLADTAPDLGDALNRLLVEEGRQPLSLPTLRPHVSAGSRGMLKVGFGLFPEHPDYPELQRRFLAHYEARLCVGTCLFPGMEALLNSLETRGISWGVVTNKPARFTLPLMEQLTLTRRAAAIVSGDSAAAPKPSPAPLLLAAETAEVPPKTCLYVGDDLRDIQAARAAGMRSAAAAWGYLGDGPALETWQADAIVHRPEELLDLLS